MRRECDTVYKRYSSDRTRQSKHLILTQALFSSVKMKFSLLACCLVAFSSSGVVDAAIGSACSYYSNTYKKVTS
jgi:hypothetical protein